MKVTLVTATYNSADTIADTLDSILNQSYDNIECIIVDGQSTDDTAHIVNEFKTQYPNRIIKWQSEKDQGIYDALNKGIKLATGDVVGFVHSDDMLADNTILKLIVDTILDEKVDGTYGDLKYVNHKNPQKVVRYWKSQKYEAQLLQQGWMPPHPTVFIKRSIYEDIGCFNTAYKIAADYDFLLRLFGNGSYRISHIPKTIIRMRLGGASNRSLSNIFQKSKEDYKALKENKIGGLWTLFLKNSSKLSQFWKH